MKRSYPFAFLATLLVSAAICVESPGAGAATGGIAYDEVTKILTSDQTAEPGTFESDYATAVSSANSASQPGKHRGLFGGIMNAVDTAHNAINMLKTGTPSTRYVYAGMERTDDPFTQTATILKPQQHQVIVLNLAKKTYRVVDTSQAQNIATNPVDRTRNATQGSQPPQPGTGKLDIRVSTTSLGARMLSNVQTTGYRMTFSMTETQSTGSCRDGSFSTSLTEYVSNYADPSVRASRVVRTAPAMRPEMLALKAGCQPTITMHAATGAQPPSGRLVMWMLATIEGNAPSAEGQMRGGFSTLVERGNVRTLTSADKGLFDIPAGFTREE